MKIKKKFIYIGCSCVGLLVLVILFLSVYGNRTPVDAEILIPRGATESQVYDTIAKAYGKSYADKVTATASVMGFELKERPGRFVVPKGTLCYRLVWKLHRGSQTPVRLTVNNMRTRKEIVENVASRFAFSASALDSLLSDNAALQKYGLDRDNAMALFMSNTYEAWWTDTPQRLIERLGEAYNAFWNAKRKEKARAIGLTPAQVIIVTSIAEEETGHADEIGRVGRLYINRINKKMRLQADPTVKFAMNGFSIRRIGRQMLQVESPYNTYRNEGLPPGPIRTVEPANVDAVLDSKPTEELYMCARPDFSGYHNFTADYSLHQRNALEYRHALDARGIKK